MAARPNILVLMSDEHDPSVCGCYGNSIVHTPALDHLAEMGTLYSRAYSSAPMCVPARMSFLSGRYPGDVNVWDNGSTLGSEFPTFASYLSAAGYETVLCGRMHMLGADRNHGFGLRLYDDMLDWTSPRQTPRRVPEARRGSNSHVTECGPGHGSWQSYDATCFDLAARYLNMKAEQPQPQPWMMVVGCMFPHFPLIAPENLYRLYEHAEIPLPDTRFEPVEQQHPAIAQLRRCFRNDCPLDDAVACTALKSYYALVTLVDQYVGQLIDIIDGSALKDNTVILYLSDHGEMAGRHGIWQKQCFYENAVRIPILLRLPDDLRSVYPLQKRIDAPVSIVDVFPTLLQLAGAAPVKGLPGISLLSPEPERAIFSEYHAQGMLNAGYMLQDGTYKLCYYVNGEPQLFDLADDPDEKHDLHGNSRYAEIENELIFMLKLICDPEKRDARAKRDQQKRLT